jgi:phytanoyl-CoA hydroxylase
MSLTETATSPSTDKGRYLRDHGYLVLENVLDNEKFVEPVLDELAGVVSTVASQWKQEGVVPRTWERERLELQLLALTSQTHGQSGLQPLTYYTDISLPKGDIHASSPMYLGEACFRLLSAEPLLDVVSEIIGPEIWLSPVGHLRIKPPEKQAPANNSLMSVTEWHQDNGVVLEEADQVETLTVWVPLTRATVQNGCLQVIPSKRDRDIHQHCGNLSIPAHYLDVDRAVPLPMEVGSVLFMHPRTPHSSLPNSTEDEVRISFDLRYQPCEEPTGRPYFPAFCLRHPGGRSTTWAEWSQGWLEARARLADQQLGPFDRWKTGDPGCG